MIPRETFGEPSYSPAHDRWADAIELSHGPRTRVPEAKAGSSAGLSLAGGARCRALCGGHDRPTQEMAVAADLDLLAYFIGMASVEAEMFIRRNAEPEAEHEPSDEDEGGIAGAAKPHGSRKPTPRP